MARQTFWDTLGYQQILVKEWEFLRDIHPSTSLPDEKGHNSKPVVRCRWDEISQI